MYLLRLWPEFLFPVRGDVNFYLIIVASVQIGVEAARAWSWLLVSNYEMAAATAWETETNYRLRYLCHPLFPAALSLFKSLVLTMCIVRFNTKHSFIFLVEDIPLCLSIMLKWNKIILSQTQLSYILLVLATSFGLGRPLSGQNIYKNIYLHLYKYFGLMMVCLGWN
jgi:hypothetical protein